jgi:hypothetical protein
MKEISSTDFPQHGEVFYFYGQALIWTIKLGSFKIYVKRKFPKYW